jgi:hypothetical protein
MYDDDRWAVVAEKSGYHNRVDGNPRDLVSFEDLLRYYSDTGPELIMASEPEIRSHIPGDIRKIMTIDSFHFSSTYAPEHIYLSLRAPRHPKSKPGNATLKIPWKLLKTPTSFFRFPLFRLWGNGFFRTWLRDV